MNVTRDNYESFFLDFLEGNLEENRVDQFLDFLEENPDLKEELQLFDTIRLPEEQILFQDKNILYKSEADSKQIIENKAIAYFEGDLDDNERKLFEAYLSAYPELETEYRLFTKTRLIPDLGIKYPNKQKLYKKSGYTVFLNWAARAAAVVVLLWGINSLYQNEDQVQQQQGNPKLAEITAKDKPLAETIEQQNKPQETEVQEVPKPVQEPNTLKLKGNPEKAKQIQEEKPSEEIIKSEHDLIAMTTISPILAQIENPSLTDNKLAIAQIGYDLNVREPSDTLSLEEYLAIRAKRAGNEGLFSFQRIARMGLNLASELSGDRIGYNETDGKITKVEFESKLLAFSIPLEKK